MQVVLGYLQPFQHNSLLKCVSQPKIAKNLLKFPILRVQGHSRSSMLKPLRRSLPVLVMISIMFEPNCNHFDAKQTHSSKITFLGGASLSPHRSRRPSLLSGMKYCHEILEILGYHTVKTQSL